MKKLDSVQYLRGIAAMLVVICHAFGFRDIAGATVRPPSMSLQYFGAIGVDIFFVISGFIITYTATPDVGKQAAAVFAKRRFIRIAPVYYIASALYLLRYGAPLIFSFIPSAHVIINKFTILKTITILPVFDGAESWPTVLTLAWTLSDELYFYIIFTLLILFGVKNRSYWLLGIIVSLALLGTFFQTQNIQWEFATNYMILEFAFGVLICIVYQKWQQVSFLFSSIMTGISVVLFGLLILFGSEKIPQYGMELIGLLPIVRVILWGIPAAMFVGGILFMEKAKPGFVKSNKWMLLIGDASYSLYLTHGLTFMALGMLVNKLPILKQIQQEVFLIMGVVAAIIAGIVFYKYVEKPVIKKLNQIFLKSKPAPVLKSI